MQKNRGCLLKDGLIFPREISGVYFGKKGKSSLETTLSPAESQSDCFLK